MTALNDRQIVVNPKLVTVSSKHKALIPQALRASAGIRPGSKMWLVELGGVVRLVPVKPPAAYRCIARGIDSALPAELDRF